MKNFLIVLTLFGLSFSLSAQKGAAKQKSDSTVYFYATLKLSSGMNVITTVDSITASPKEVKQQLVTINENNKPRVLEFARTELGNNRLSATLNKSKNILEVQPSLRELNIALNEFLRMNDGKVYSLRQFTFSKPNKNEKIKVKRYEE